MKVQKHNMHPYVDIPALERPSIVIVLLLDLLDRRLVILTLILLVPLQRKSAKFVPNVREYIIRAVKRSLETPGIASGDAKIGISI